LEDLPPVRVSAPDLNVCRFSWWFDVKWLVVQSSLDSQRFLIEVPFLSLSSVSYLDDHVSVVDEVEVSALS
jgi:hypothetical protein